jgi:hypothetical protein
VAHLRLSSVSGVFILDTGPATNQVKISPQDVMNGESLEAGMFITILADRVNLRWDFSSYWKVVNHVYVVQMA